MREAARPDLCEGREVTRVPTATGVGSSRFSVAQQRLLCLTALRGARDMYRYQQPELASIVEFWLIHLRFDRAGAKLAAPCYAERDEVLIRPDLPAGRQIDDEIEPGRLLDREVTRLHPRAESCRAPP
jgi:hypothetical protein